MKLYSYSSCSTCCRAIKWLNNSIDFELIDILNNPPSKQILILASEAYGDRRKLLNTSGLAYRSIGADVVKKMSKNDFFDTISKEPRLIKRPFLFKDNNFFLFGFKEEKWVELLL